MLSEVVDKKHLAPNGIRVGSMFQRGSSRNFLDIMSMSGKLLERYKRSVVLEGCSVSDHTYVLHEFRGWAMPRNTGLFKFSTKDIVLEMFLRNFDNTKSKLFGAQLDEAVNHEDSAEEHRGNLRGFTQESFSP
jgi:hypothetical protein